MRMLMEQTVNTDARKDSSVDMKIDGDLYSVCFRDQNKYNEQIAATKPKDVQVA